MDPIGLAGGLNLYGYAGGDPINHSDPFGLCPPKWLCDMIGTTAGQSAVEYYAAQAISPGSSGGAKVAATVGGLFASLWTPDTYLGTATTLVVAALSGDRASEPGDGVTHEGVERPTPGGDGGRFRHIIEKVNGRTNSVNHQVHVDGTLVHQHQRHRGKSGQERQFPDEWVQYPEVKKP